MQEITIEMVRGVFQDIIKGNVTREQANDWAHKIKTLGEQHKLSYIPANREKQIWNAVMFLYGVDLKESQQTYLHCIKDIESVMLSELGKES